MKSIIKLVGLLKLVNKVNEREHKQPYKHTMQSYIGIIDITKNNMMTTRLKQP